MGIARLEIKAVFKHFLPEVEVLGVEEFVSGHINDTFLIRTNKQQDYVLQKINSSVFKKAKELIENKVLVSEYLQQNAQESVQLQFVRTKGGEPFFEDKNGMFWNMSVFIKGSKTFESVSSPDLAYEGGKLIGDFLNKTKGFDPNVLDEILPNFHEMSFRYNQFEDALLNASEERVKLAEEQIAFVNACREEMHLLEKYKNEGKLTLRVTHNDTKISNALFEKDNKGICMIDTDTVMLGIAHYDFGDAVRTFCSTAVEDETNLEKVLINMDYFKALTKGFLEQMHDHLSEFEITCLHLAGKTITFIMGLRMLTDFLNNDIYYKTSYNYHNLDRSKNQFKLVEEIENHMNEMKRFINEEYEKLN